MKRALAKLCKYCFTLRQHALGCCCWAFVLWGPHLQKIINRFVEGWWGGVEGLKGRSPSSLLPRQDRYKNPHATPLKLPPPVAVLPRSCCIRQKTRHSKQYSKQPEGQLNTAVLRQTACTCVIQLHWREIRSEVRVV